MHTPAVFIIISSSLKNYLKTAKYLKTANGWNKTGQKRAVFYLKTANEKSAVKPVVTRFESVFCGLSPLYTLYRGFTNNKY